MPPTSCAAGRVVAVAIAVGFLAGTVTGSAAAAWVAGAAAALALVVWSRARERRSASCGVGCAPRLGRRERARRDRSARPRPGHVEVLDGEPGPDARSGARPDRATTSTAAHPAG